MFLFPGFIQYMAPCQEAFTMHEFYTLWVDFDYCLNDLSEKAIVLVGVKHSTIPGDNIRLEKMVGALDLHVVHLSEKINHSWMGKCQMYTIPSFHGNPSLECNSREILRIFSGISHGAALAQAAALKFQLQQPVSRALKIQLSRDQLTLVICCI